MPIYIVVIIIALLSALACYAYISQSIEKRRVQKQRILMTLKTKHRNFVHLINGFPPHFLTNDLSGLMYRSLINTCEQLSIVEPKDPRHLDDVTLYTNQLDILSKNNTAQRARVDNPQIMKDLKQHLQELQHFLVQQEALKVISKVQFVAYIDQIKRLALQMSVDAYLHQAKQAQQIGKLRLAIHFFKLAKKLLSAENSARTYDKQIVQLDGIVEKLEAKANLNGEAHEAPQAAKLNDSAAKEWDSFAPPDDKWKKKRIYD